MTHIPGHVAVGDTADSISLNDFVGTSVTDASDPTFSGILRQTPGGGWVIDAGGTPRRQRRLTSGMGIVSSAGRLVVLGSGFTVAEDRQLSQSQLSAFFGGDGGTGGSAPSFAATQAAQTQAEAFARAQAQRDAEIAARAAALANQRAEEAAEAARAFAEEQAEIDRELRLREARLSTARDLVNIRSAEAREARTQGTSLAGQDPFRFLAVARGLQPPTGTTPSAAFKQNLRGAAQFEAPDLTGLDSTALESVIGKLSQSITPTGSSTLGFAHGGVLSAAGSDGGPFSFGGGSQAVRVGEAGPEILILRPDGSVEVVPETGSAQGGGVFDLGGFGPLFERLRQSVGVDPVLAGARASGPGGRLDELRSALGFLPVGQEQETSAPFQAFAGPTLRIRGGLQEALAFQGVPRAGPEALRISNLIGQLPAPFKIPSSFFQSLFPAEQTALISAYRLAGVPEADFRHLQAAPQLSFTPQRATAVG
jgi:hypothetical protein